MIIREFLPTDRATYLALAEKMFNSPAVSHALPIAYHERTFDNIIATNPYVKGFIIEENNTACGYAILTFGYSTEAAGIMVQIEDLFLLPEARGKGIGKQFFAFVRKHFPAKRYRLEVEKQNLKAQALYKREGFKYIDYLQMVNDVE